MQTIAVQEYMSALTLSQNDYYENEAIHRKAPTEKDNFQRPSYNQIKQQIAGR